jgi:DNA-binding winged helix-turn-helix (wHTH) protein
MKPLEDHKSSRNMRYVVACLGSSLGDTEGLQSPLQSIGLEFVSLERLGGLNALLGTHILRAIVVLFPGNRALVSDFYKEIEQGRFVGIPRILIASSSKEIMLARSMGYIADEYLLKPIDVRELVSIMRGRGMSAYGDIVGDPYRERVQLRGFDLALTPTAARILLLLMGRPGHVFTRDEIIENIWGINKRIDDRTVDRMIRRIRDTLQHKVAVDPIRTIRGIGYAFDETYSAAKSRPRPGGSMGELQAGE